MAVEWDLNSYRISDLGLWAASGLYGWRSEAYLDPKITAFCGSWAIILPTFEE